LSAKNGYELVKFFFLLTFAAAIPAIISGGIAERAKFNSQLAEDPYTEVLESSLYSCNLSVETIPKGVVAYPVGWKIYPLLEPFTLMSILLSPEQSKAALVEAV
jgi:hypothetical protein